MKLIYRSLLLAFALSGMSLAAQANPTVDPLLQPYLHSQDQRVIRVIAVFKDVKPVPAAPHMRSNHEAIELAMRENSRASQMETYRSLLSLRTGGMKIGLQPLWIINAMIIDLPVSELHRLAMN